MKKPKGKFITIEGCEGVGKSTQIALLKSYCAKNGIKAVFTREPGGTPIAEKIRNIILDPSCKEMDAFTELLLYAASRRQHTYELIMPALERGDYVFCDRYSDSTVAYQVYGRGLPIKVVESVCLLASVGVEIDATIFLDLSPAKGLDRAAVRSTTDRIEREGIDFHRRVYQGFKEIAKNNLNRVCSIDASRTSSDVHKKIIKALVAKGIFTNLETNSFAPFPTNDDNDL